MTNAAITQLRLHNQQISNHNFNKPEQVVEWLGAVQAQDYYAALWAIGLRMDNASQDLVEKAITDKKIIRSWPMRGTLHFVAPENIRWMLKLLTPRIIARSQTQYKQSGLDNKVFTKSKKIFIKALEGGRQLTRNQLYQHLEKVKISTAEQRGLHILGYLAQEGLICLAARKGKQQTFALLDEWVPNTKTLTSDEAIVKLTQLYFTSHGPATVHDFAWWTGLTIAEANRGIEMTKSQLHSETIANKIYWMAQQTAAIKNKTTNACMLPVYDEYLVGYKDRSAAHNPAYDNEIKMSIFQPAIIINGKVSGTWRRNFEKKTLNIVASAFSSFTKNQELGIYTEGDRYSNFIGALSTVMVIETFA